MTVGQRIALAVGLVAVLALLWQIVSWTRGRRSSVRVTLQRVFYDVANGFAGPAVEVKVYNRSPTTTVRVVRVGLYLGRLRHAHIQMGFDEPIAGGRIPGVVQPHDAAAGYFAIERLKQHADLTRKLGGWVVLADDKERRSKRRRLFTKEAWEAWSELSSRSGSGPEASDPGVQELRVDVDEEPVAAPRLSIKAEFTGGATTTSGPDGARIVSYAHVILILGNADEAGEATNVKVELRTVAAPGFNLRVDSPETFQYVEDGDTKRIVWQPGTLGPGLESNLLLMTDSFTFDNESASARLRVTADRMKPIDQMLDAHVSRYDRKDGTPEYEVTLSRATSPDQSG